MHLNYKEWLNSFCFTLLLLRKIWIFSFAHSCESFRFARNFFVLENLIFHYFEKVKLKMEIKQKPEVLTVYPSFMLNTLLLQKYKIIVLKRWQKYNKTFTCVWRNLLSSNDGRSTIKRSLEHSHHEVMILFYFPLW